MKLYSHPLSLHCYKVRLLFSFLEQPYEIEDIDLINDQQRSAEYLAMHPLGKVPLLEDEGQFIWYSEAILVYLAHKFENESWLPADAKKTAQVNSWLDFSVNEMTTGLAAARAQSILGNKGVKFIDRQKIDLERSTEIAHSSLSILNSHLTNRNWLVGDSPTIADIAINAVLARANEAKIEIKAYPDVEAWSNRFRQLPRFVEF